MVVCHDSRKTCQSNDQPDIPDDIFCSVHSRSEVFSKTIVKYDHVTARCYKQL